MTISPWSANQQHCLALMGIDAIYYEGTEKNSHKELRVNSPTSEKFSKQSSEQLTQTHPIQAPRSTPSTPNSLLKEFKEKLVKVSKKSVENTQDSVAKKSAIESVEKPTESVMVGTKSNHIMSESLESRINAYSRELFVLGHQLKFTDVLLGQRLIADLSLYLTYQKRSFEYVMLNSDNALTQLSNLAKKMTEQRQVDNSVFYLLPQGDDQANQLNDLTHDIDTLKSLIEKKNVVVLPPLTKLLSHPENKRELLQTLMH